MLSGELHEIKKRYGTNSIHLEYEGDGEFLKSFSFIRRADVYQNYAELELTDISKSSELLANLNGKLSLRKFEIVEPSLNSIFINVVGGPEKIEQASEKPIPVLQIQQKSTNDLVMKDGRVRKALFSLIGTVYSYSCLYCVYFSSIASAVYVCRNLVCCDHLECRSVFPNKEKSETRIHGKSIAGGTAMKSQSVPSCSMGIY